MGTAPRETPAIFPGEINKTKEGRNKSGEVANQPVYPAEYGGGTYNLGNAILKD